jgi:hypothetical protein
VDWLSYYRLEELRSRRGSHLGQRTLRPPQTANDLKAAGFVDQGSYVEHSLGKWIRVDLIIRGGRTHGFYSVAPPCFAESRHVPENSGGRWESVLSHDPLGISRILEAGSNHDMDYSRKPVHVLFSALDFALMARGAKTGLDYFEFRNNPPVDYRPQTPVEEEIWEELTHPRRYAELVKYPSVFEVRTRLPFSGTEKYFTFLYECALKAAEERYETGVSLDEPGADRGGQAKTIPAALGLSPSLETRSNHNIDYSREPIHGLLLALDSALMMRNAEPGFDYAEFRNNPPVKYRPITPVEKEIWAELIHPRRYQELVEYRSLFETRTKLPFSRMNTFFAFLYECALKAAEYRFKAEDADPAAEDEPG